MSERRGAAMLDKIRVGLASAAISAAVTSAYWVIAYDLTGTQREAAQLSPAPASAQPPATAKSTSLPPPKIQRTRMEPITPVQIGALAIPVVGVKPTQLVDTFNDARESGVRIHDAIDIMAPRGTPVIAAAPGIVEKIWQSEKGGLTVYVRSPDKRSIYYYAHLDSYADSLAEGKTVKAGDPVGTVGSTGNASPDGPHLHFAVMMAEPDDSWSGGTAINPYPLLTASR